MKKIFTLFLFIALLFPATYAQKGLQVGANYMYLSTSILNQNTWGIDKEYDYKFTYNHSYGIDVGYQFNDRMGIYSGFWFTNLGQGYTDEYDGSSWERSLTLKYNVIPAMLRFSSSKHTINFIGGVGVLFAFMNKAEQEWLQDGVVYEGNIENISTAGFFNVGASDVTDRFAKNDIILNLELGFRIFLMDKLYLDLTGNAGYGVNDINDAKWQFENTDGEYKGSHNVYGSFKAGVAYVLFGD